MIESAPQPLAGLDSKPITSLRAPWPRCGAHARSTGQPCRAEGSAVGGRCWLHCGATFTGWRDPKPEWTLFVVEGGCWLEPSRRARGRWPAERRRFAAKWPQRIRQWVALRLVASGKVQVASVHHRAAGTLLRELARAGVEIVDETPRGSLVKRLRFVAPPWKGPERRRG
jgi:hypothetical protein